MLLSTEMDILDAETGKDTSASITAAESGKSQLLTLAMFAIYGLLLIGLVLVKFPFRYDLSPAERELNLVPFTGLFSNFGAFHLSEVLQNIAIFIPFGIYLSMLTRDWSFTKRLLPIIATTVGCEAIQFITATGRADITDVVDNVLGGMIGILVYGVVAKVLGAKAQRSLNIAGLVLTVGTLATVAVVLTNTLREQ